MYKKILVLFFLISNYFVLYSQQDPDAKAILDRVAEKTKSYNTIKANFSLNIKDRKENTSSRYTGTIYIKGMKYRYEAMGTLIIYDGKTLITYYKDDNEIVLNEPDMNDDDFLNNPVKILNWYNRDFKYTYNGIINIDDKKVYQIDLFPKNLKQPYSRIKIYIDTANLLPLRISTIGKEGIDYIVELEKYQLNTEIPDSFFVLSQDIYKKSEVIDLRKN